MFEHVCLSFCICFCLSLITILCKLCTYLGDQLRWAICFSDSPSLCFTLFCWHSFLLLHSWLNKLIDWLIDWLLSFYNTFMLKIENLSQSRENAPKCSISSDKSFWGRLVGFVLMESFHALYIFGCKMIKTA